MGVHIIFFRPCQPSMDTAAMQGGTTIFKRVCVFMTRAAEDECLDTAALQGNKHLDVSGDNMAT